MGKVTVFQPDKLFLEQKDVASWPIWEKEVSAFPWTYAETEECYILEGKVIVSTEEGDFHIKAGDFVTFEKGLACHWDINEPIRKHYNFK